MTSPDQLKMDFNAGSSRDDSEPPQVRDAEKPADQNVTGKILDGVVDQNGAHWIRWGTDRSSVWFSVADLAARSGSVFARLADAGVPLLTSKSQNGAKADVQAFVTAGRCRPGLVAGSPGWVADAYVCGDGRKFGAAETEIIIGFTPEPKFTPKGSLDEWKAAVTPFADEPMVVFALAFGLVGPMLELVPDDYQNPLVELYGALETGKSTLAKAAASIWSGRPSKNVGGCESWDLTLGAIDTQKRRHQDSLLILNEAHLATRELIKDAIFKLAEPGERLRLDTNLAAVQHSRLALLSTTNSSIAELSGCDEATISRMVTITADLRHGILKSTPEGFADAKSAVEHLGRAVSDAYGTAGPAFAAALASASGKGADKLRAAIAKQLESYLAFPEAQNRKFARHAKVFALTAVAGFRAARNKVLPFTEKQVVRAVREIHRRTIGMPEPDAPELIHQILAYLDRVRAKLVRVADLEEPLSPERFVRKAGFVLKVDDVYELYVPSGRFQREFPDFKDLMKALRAQGRARTENGKKPKLTVKTPNAICAKGRVYCIKLTRDQVPVEVRRSSLRSQ